MRLKSISTIEEGNQYLKEFIKDYNKRFGKAPQKQENAHRELPTDKDLDKILCRKEERKVTKTLEVQYKHTTYQLTPKDGTRQLKGATVLISELETRITIEFQGKEIEYKVYEEQQYKEQVLDRKRIDAFLDRKKNLSIIERQRKGIAINF